ncbi:MAG: ribonuclease HII [Proteobacteria bacterium]|nr:ribonuclease HII [Pseudomonadota bacterium]
MPDFSLEDASGAARVAGVDEAGRGPWAGPVVAAAVILDRDGLDPDLALGLDDSKKLPAARRERLFAALQACALIGVGRADVADIDSMNILGATLLAMGRAVSALGAAPDLALIDGTSVPDLPCPARPVIGGDGLSLSIAAASIVAKVTRDRLMSELALAHPGYGWERNKGYGTPEHRAALETLGVTPHHRRSFRPIRKIMRMSSALTQHVGLGRGG